MKVLAVIALLAVVAYAWEEAKEDVVFSANSADFIGELQDKEGGEIHQFNTLEQLTMQNTALFSMPSLIPIIVSHLIPSCKRGPSHANPICAAKCVRRGHKWGYCAGKVCICFE